MAAIEHLAIVTLGPDDTGCALKLSTEAHWNQNEADWRFFINDGTVLGVRDDDSRLVATAALLPYGSGNAWISMVLVTADCRRRGLATRLVDACLEAAAKQRLTAWLDATPAGAAVYGPLGFAPTLQLRRLHLENSTAAKIAAPRLSPNDDLAPFIARDHRGMGFGRGALLRELSGRAGSRLWSDGDAAALVRDGRTARHIGPLFADGPDAADRALALVDAIARSESAPLLIDVVAMRAEFLSGLASTGWRIERPFQRMRFGPATADTTEPPFAVAGPEYG